MQRYIRATVLQLTYRGAGMKKVLIMFVLIGMWAVFAAELPDFINVSCGKVKIKLDHRKFWNINRIEYEGELFGVDNTGAHYGFTHCVKGIKGFVGSGHKETGVAEKVDNIYFVVDGQVCEAAPVMKAQKSFFMEKVSTIGTLTVTYSIALEDNTLFERTNIVFNQDLDIQHVYCFMHPWSTAFTRYYGLKPDGTFMSIDLVANNKVPNSKYMPKIALFNPQTGGAVATALYFEHGKGKDARRMLWDRPYYRKDYIILENFNPVPAGYRAGLSVKTVFFRSTPEKFTKDAEKTFLLM